MTQKIDELEKLILNDFAFYKKRFFPEISQTGPKTISEAVKYEFWNAKSIRYLVRATIKKTTTQLTYNIQTHSIGEKKLIQESTGTMDINKLREFGHSLSNIVYQSITGKPSIFHSKILFVSDKNKGTKELYIMDFDGGNATQLTYHRGTVISPAISHDGTKVMYSLIKSGKSKSRNINLYLMDLKTRKSNVISSKKGINSGAIFMPDGEHIALTLSHTGNAEIYKMNLKTKKLHRITKHFAPDVDPAINVSGSLMTFLSGRPGKAMIYTLDPKGTEKSIKRISYVGKYNATPRFSPDGKEIAFSSWLDNRFDIFRINADGTGLSRLTKNFGSNEDPTYSNDGEFIAFSSLRVLSKTKATQGVYVMNKDGEILGELTKNFGNCITPRWTKF